jgi:hypothetical protein
MVDELKREEFQVCDLIKETKFHAVMKFHDYPKVLQAQAEHGVYLLLEINTKLSW